MNISFVSRQWSAPIKTIAKVIAQNLTFPENADEIHTISTKIDSLLERNLHLLSSDSRQNWFQIRDNYADRERVHQLREGLRIEYNDEVIEKHRDLTGITIERIL